MVLTVTLNPCVDKTVFLDRMRAGRFNLGAACSVVAGGKGLNAARMAAKLGEPATALTFLGGHSGGLAADLVGQRDHGVTLAAVWIAADTRTITTVYERARGRATAFVEPNAQVSAEEAAALLARYRELLPAASVVVLSGSSPQASLDGLYGQMVGLARQAGTPVILDTYGAALAQGLAAQPDLVKPNVHESELYLGRSLPGRRDWWAAATALRQAGAGAVCLSLGRQGALLDSPAGRWSLRPPRVQTVNPVGSGDCLAAGLAVGMSRGRPLVEGAVLGVAAGAANAAVWEAAGASAAEVQRLASRVRRANVE